MKTTLLSISISFLTLTACVKKHSCFCYDENGRRNTGRELTTNNKAQLNELKSDCTTEDNRRKSNGSGYCEYK